MIFPCAENPQWAGKYTNAKNVMSIVTAIIHAATETATPAKMIKPKNGLKRTPTFCFPLIISWLHLLCPMTYGTLQGVIKNSFIIFCSSVRQRVWTNYQLIQNISAANRDILEYCTHGQEHFLTILISIT